jgi:hypothetical protein
MRPSPDADIEPAFADAGADLVASDELDPLSELGPRVDPWAGRGERIASQLTSPLEIELVRPGGPVEDHMTKLLKRAAARPYALAMVALNAVLTSALALAQTSTTTGGDVTSTTSTTTSTIWYGQWWVWAVGVAVFLIIIVALTNRGGRSA